MSINYRNVTEFAGDYVTQQQFARLCHRYYWAGQYCQGKDVLEAACGTGPGLGYLSKLAKSLRAGDYCQATLDLPRSYYGDTIELQKFDAQTLPFTQSLFDVVILLEAIYFLPNPKKFLQECRRVLRPKGTVLIAATNKDSCDFTPCLYSYQYYGIVELDELFRSCGFDCSFFGYLHVSQLSRRRQMARPVKKIAANLGLIPTAMKGKKFLKRLIFGKLVKMPVEIVKNMTPYTDPAVLSPKAPDYNHKVIYCRATIA